MARHFHLITPCGGNLSEAHETRESAILLAQANPSIEFFHHLVYNNGLHASGPMPTHTANYHVRETDLGAVGSRAKARNCGLDHIASLPPLAAGDSAIVCFIDAGDVLIDEGAPQLAFDLAATAPARSLWAFSARIAGADVNSTRRPRPLHLRKINNPFFIGATYVTTELAIQARFREGAKEDWKYWLDLLEIEPHVELRPELAYEYRVVSTTDHMNRKRRLFRDQYRFFSEYLGYGNGPKTIGSMIAHSAIAGTSWIRRSNRLRPWMKRSR